MSGKTVKRMCKVDRKMLDKQFDTVVEAVREPAYLCRKCARVARRKSCLCKPKAIEEKD